MPKLHNFDVRVSRQSWRRSMFSVPPQAAHVQYKDGQRRRRCYNNYARPLVMLARVVRGHPRVCLSFTAFLSRPLPQSSNSSIFFNVQTSGYDRPGATHLASQPCSVSFVPPALSGDDDDDGDERSETTSGHKASEVAGPPNGTLTLTTRYPGHSKDTLLI